MSSRDSSSLLLWPGLVLAVFLAAIAFTISFDALLLVGLASGLSPRLGWMFPCCIDGFILLATWATWAFKARGRSTLYPWLVLVLFSAFSLVGNALHAHPVAIDGLSLPVWAPPVIMPVPPIALLTATHLIVLVSTRKRSGAAGSETVNDILPVSGVNVDGPDGGAGMAAGEDASGMGLSVASSVPVVPVLHDVDAAGTGVERVFDQSEDVLSGFEASAVSVVAGVSSDRGDADPKAGERVQVAAAPSSAVLAVSPVEVTGLVEPDVEQPVEGVDVAGGGGVVASVAQAPVDASAISTSISASSASSASSAVSVVSDGDGGLSDVDVRWLDWEASLPSGSRVTAPMAVQAGLASSVSTAKRRLREYRDRFPGRFL